MFGLLKKVFRILCCAEMSSHVWGGHLHWHTNTLTRVLHALWCTSAVTYSVCACVADYKSFVCNLIIKSSYKVSSVTLRMKNEQQQEMRDDEQLYYFMPHICIILSNLGQISCLSCQCLWHIIALENMLNILRHSDSCHKIWSPSKHRGTQTAVLNSHTNTKTVASALTFHVFLASKTPSDRGLNPTGDLFPISLWLCVKLRSGLPARCLLGFMHNTGKTEILK